MLHPFGFGVGPGPGQADDFGEKHFGELVTQHEVLRKFAALRGELDGAATLDFDMAVAGHAFDGGSHGGGGDVKFFGEPGADRGLLFFEHFPNRFEVIFLRNAGFIAAQRRSLSQVMRSFELRLRPEASRKG